MPSSRAVAAAVVVALRCRLVRPVAVQFLPGQGHSHWRFCPHSTCFRLMFVVPAAEASSKLPGQKRKNVPNTKCAKSRTDGATTGSTCATLLPGVWGHVHVGFLGVHQMGIGFTVSFFRRFTTRSKDFTPNGLWTVKKGHVPKTLCNYWSDRQVKVKKQGALKNFFSFL